MRIAPIAVDDELRLQDLYDHHILDSESENEYNEILEVAAQIYGCPMAAITFIDKDRQWFKASKGIGVPETSRDVAFCAHTILSSDVLLVPDASSDERFRDNPFVTGEPNLRFYAGAPIVSPKGFRLGALCVLDSEPRDLTPAEARALTILSRQVSRLLELRMKNRLLKERAEKALRLERETLTKTLERQEAERLHLSTELHEEIAQRLAATKFYLELAEGGEGNGALVSKSRELVEGLIRQVQALSRSLTPSTLDHPNLRDLLHTLVQDFSVRHALPARLYYNGSEEMEPGLALTLYRIAEEGLRNVLDHASATEVRISVQATESLHMLIEDNGRGIPLPGPRRGSGMQSILSRLKDYSAEVDLSGLPGGGCRLMVTVPEQKAVNRKQGVA